MSKLQKIDTGDLRQASSTSAPAGFVVGLRGQLARWRRLSQDPKVKGKVAVLRQYRQLPLILCVVLPTVLATLYYTFIAADQYQTDIVLSVRSAQGGAMNSLLGTVLGSSGLNQSSIDANSIAQFIASHDAVRDLDSSLDLRSLYSLPMLDFIARLSKTASFEEIVKYYPGMVEATFDTAAGVTRVSVKAFRPEDAYAIASELIQMSENLINSFNRRAEEDRLRLSYSEVERAEKRLAGAREAIQRFRLEHKEIDPTQSTLAVSDIIAKLEAEQATVSTQMSEMSSYMSPKSLQIEALRKKQKAIETQISEEKQRLTGQNSTMTNLLLQYEALQLENEMSSTIYTSAISSLESSRIEAHRQRSYVVPVVSPHIPEEATYPLKIRNIFFVLIGSFVLFAIGRLIVSGIREHVVH